MFHLTPHQIDALNTQRSISLTANAGSGKTYVLAKRFLEVILNTDTLIHEIAAITFTEKAAGELYKRIADELSKLSMEKNTDILQKQKEKLRKQLVSAKISTIHSFCVDLLREFPVEASLDANFIPIDQRSATELSELSIENIVRKKLEQTGSKRDIKLLIRLLGSKKALAKELVEVVQKRNILFQIKESVYKESNEICSDLFRQIFESEVEIILKIELPDLLFHLTQINVKVLSISKENKFAEQVKSVLTGISDCGTNEKLKKINELNNLVCTKQGAVKNKGYLSNILRVGLSASLIIVERFFNNFKEFFIDEGKLNIESELAKYGRALLNISLDVIKEYENIKNQMGYLDFEDILLKTKEILRSKGVRESINKKYKYLLVDEYQDTNEIQYEIFLPIVDNLKKGNLFIVGDEKQSIYRFRDAELEVFSKTREDIRKVKDTNLILTLPDSFRMASAICLFTNYLFNNLFDVPNKLYNEVEHSDIVCARNDSFAGGVEFLISEGNDEFREAELVAKRILKLKNDCENEVPNWSSIAVLVRKRSAFSELEKTFIKYEIPVTVVSGTGFYQQQSISDIYNYFAFLFNDEDDAALIGILRSPFFSVSDTQIFQLSIFPGNSFWEKLKNASLRDNFWGPIYSTIAENLKLTNRLTIPTILRKILNESDFISTIVSRKNGKQETNNLSKLISITIKFFNQGFNSLYDYLSFLKNSITHYGEEAQAGIEAEGNCVNLMTIHQAKGLEYSAVFLYGCNGTIQSGNIKGRSFKIDKNYGILTKVPHNENYFCKYYSAPLVKLFNFTEEKKAIAELKRLLYVGVTRAKNFLFLSMTEPLNRSRRLNSFSALINEGINPDFSKESFTLERNLKFLQQIDDTFKTIDKNVIIQIPITKYVELIEKQEDESTKKTPDPKLLMNTVNDNSKGEIISATKYSVFNACPRKYNLIYNFNLSGLIKDYELCKKISKHRDEYEFNSNEQRKITFEEPNIESPGFSNIRGRIIHQILQDEILPKNIGHSVNKIIDRENVVTGSSPNAIQQMKNEILNTVEKFIGSEEFKYIKSIGTFKNELEVYCKISDHYLFGIIDKVIFNEDKIIIVDYKTDNVNDSTTMLRAEKYLSQLKFYALILKRFYDNISQVEIRIIFLKYPDRPFVKYFTINDEKETLKGIEKMVSSLRNSIYSVNLEHCSQCLFAVNKGECILGRE
jgi:ATP-dependent helicase/nuclease subunit A